MAVNDWNGDGKNDAFDNFIDYKMSGGASDHSGGGYGGGNGSGAGVIAVLSMLAGLIEVAALFTACGIDVEDVPSIILFVLWLLGSLTTATLIKKYLY